MSPPPILECRGLTCRLGRIVAVRDLALSVLPGDCYGFLGVNGAGKTTTLRCLLGLVRPQGGEIRLFGQAQPKHRIAALRRVGALVEAPAFYPHLSGERNLRLQARMIGPQASASIRETLRMVGLSARAGDRVSAYSLGMKQRLGIAAALLGKPELVILDEPTNGLDPQGIHEIRGLIRGLNKDQGITFLVSSHLLSEVEMLCNRVGIIEEGRMIKEGDVPSMLHDEQETLVFDTDQPETTAQALATAGLVPSREGERVLVRMPKRQAASVNRTLVSLGINVYAIFSKRRTLEEFFLDLTIKPRAMDPKDTPASGLRVRLP